MSTASASRRRGRGRELRYAEHLEELHGGMAYTKEVGPVNVDYDEDDQIVGYEFLLSGPLEIHGNPNTHGSGVTLIVP